MRSLAGSQPAGRAPTRFRVVPFLWQRAIYTSSSKQRHIGKTGFEKCVVAVDFARSTALPNRTDDCILYSVRESARSVLWQYIGFCHPEREPLHFLSWRVLPLPIPDGPFLPVNAALLLCAYSPRLSVKNL